MAQSFIHLADYVHPTRLEWPLAREVSNFPPTGTGGGVSSTLSDTAAGVHSAGLGVCPAPTPDNRLSCFRVDRNGGSGLVLLELGTDTDFDAVLRVRRIRSQRSGAGVDDGVGIFCRYSNTGNGYSFRLGSIPTSYRVLAGVKHGSSLTRIGSTVTGALSVKSEHMAHSAYLRVNVNGSDFSCRAWWDDETQPSSWDLTVNDTTYTSGSHGIIIGGYENLVDLVSYSIGTGSDDALIPPVLKRVQLPLQSGILGGYEPQSIRSGSPVAAKVRLYSQFYGTLLGEGDADPTAVNPGTSALGNYSIQVKNDYGVSAGDRVYESWYLPSETATQQPATATIRDMLTPQ